MEIRQLRQVIHVKCRLKLLDHQLSISNTDTTRDHRTDVTDDRLTNLIRQLRHKLVTHDKTQAILSSLGHDRLKTIRRKVLELINIQREVDTIFFCHICARHRRRLKLHHKDNTEQSRVQLTHFTLRQVDQQNLLIVHDIAHIKATLRLPDDISHRVIRDERTKLRDNPRDHLTRLI